MQRVFVDFDGVLRRDGSPRERLDADCVERFETAILASPDARVVIASTWRLMHSLAALRGMFSAALAARIEGATPMLRILDVNRMRAAEVEAYLDGVGAPRAGWLAIDDKPALYGPGAPVIAVDPNRGFDAACAESLASWLLQTREHEDAA